MNARKGIHGTHYCMLSFQRSSFFMHRYLGRPVAWEVLFRVSYSKTNSALEILLATTAYHS
eukprot:11097-Heterococcus_DN1.PRE.2